MYMFIFAAFHGGVSGISSCGLHALWVLTVNTSNASTLLPHNGMSPFRLVRVFLFFVFLLFLFCPAFRPLEALQVLSSPSLHPAFVAA